MPAARSPDLNIDQDVEEVGADAASAPGISAKVEVHVQVVDVC